MNGDVNKIAVVGLGYIGLPTAAVLASRGFDVIGVDISAETVQIINQGQIHISEPDLDMLVQSAVTAGNLTATTELCEADAFIIAVPTPFDENLEPDMQYVKAVAVDLAPVLKKGNLVILESTCPVGTTESLSELLAGARSDLSFPQQAGDKADVNVVHCPERVLPGRVLRELVENDRVVGGMSKTCADRAVSLYKSFVRGECLVTDVRTAEMAKLTENSFRDLNIAFANELSMICDHLNIDVWRLIELANRHPRVNILQPGPGVGGHCIAVDPWFIVNSAPDCSRLIQTAREVNDSKPGWVVDNILQKTAGLATPVIACLGLSFKANIEDLRESPAVSIVADLAQKSSARLLVSEPYVSCLPDQLSSFDNVSLQKTEEAIQMADVVVLLVDHDEFSRIDPSCLEGKEIIDTRGMWRN